VPTSTLVSRAAFGNLFTSWQVLRHLFERFVPFTATYLSDVMRFGDRRDSKRAPSHGNFSQFLAVRTRTGYKAHKEEVK